MSLELCSFITGEVKETNENAGVSVSQVHTLKRSFVSVAVIKHPDKKQLREKGFVSAHSSWIESIMVRKSRQEPGAASQVKPPVKRASKVEFDFKMFSFIIKNNKSVILCLFLPCIKKYPTLERWLIS